VRAEPSEAGENTRDVRQLLANRLSAGKPVIWLGEEIPELRVPRLPWVRLDLRQATSGLALAQQILLAIGQTLGVHPARWIQAAEGGLRRQLFEARAERPWGQALLLALRELGDTSGGCPVLAFQGAESARPEVSELILQLIPSCEALSIPVFFGVRASRLERPEVAPWIQSLIARWGDECVLDATRSDAFTLERDATLGAAAGSAPESKSLAADPSPHARELPAELRRLLRLVAAAEPPVSIDAIAGVDGSSPLSVLERLQQAKDLGIPVIDLGASRVDLPAELRRALVAELLPSLVDRYRREVRGLRRSEGAAGAVGEDIPAESMLREATSSTFQRAPSGFRSELGRDQSAPLGETEDSQPTAGGDTPPGPATGTQDPTLPADPAIASLLTRVRDLEHAIAMGLYAEAIATAEALLGELDRAYDDEETRELRIAALVGLARAHFLGAGSSGRTGGSQPSFGHARVSIDAAHALLQSDDSVATLASVEELRAEILYEIGSKECLELALKVIVELTQRYLDAGQALSAAGLLNEQAAIELRLGDSVRAHHLLTRAREVFQEQAARDPHARLEMAQTDHLLARLVLHVDARPGLETEACEKALGHAHTAEALYSELGRKRELARVHETIGRLEARLGHTKRAQAALGRAAAVQQEIGDALGLARSAGALADLAADLGGCDTALQLLGRSLELNLQVGSLSGLSHNREAVQRMNSSGAFDGVQELQSLLEAIDRAEERAKSLPVA